MPPDHSWAGCYIRPGGKEQQNATTIIPEAMARSRRFALARKMALQRETERRHQAA
jgi:hypothetical protein